MFNVWLYDVSHFVGVLEVHVHPYVAKVGYSGEDREKLDVTESIRKEYEGCVESRPENRIESLTKNCRKGQNLDKLTIF